MRKLLIAAVFLLSATSAFSATATWTGRMEQVQTVTYKTVWKCWYNYNGQIITKLFENSCPFSIELQ